VNAIGLEEDGSRKSFSSIIAILRPGSNKNSPSNSPRDQKNSPVILRRDSLQNSQNRKTVETFTTTKGNTLITYHASSYVSDMQYFIIPNHLLNDRDRMIFENSSKIQEQMSSDKDVYR
jgi:hypothetical protein